MAPSGPPLVLLLVGTDHHRFDRAVGWMDTWTAGHDARVVIQYGTSSPPLHAEGHALFPVQELDALMAEAAVVVCHGGPGTIMSARASGAVPIVIPREHALGEHVDDHQVRFAGRVGEAGQAHVVRSEPELAALLQRALRGDTGFRIHQRQGDPAPPAVARFAELVDRLVRPGR